MIPFEYQRATDTSTAVAAVAGSADGVFLGGGTNLVDHMKLGVSNPELLVDVSRLSDTVETGSDGGVRIGSGVRNSELAAHPMIRERYPVLSQALLAGASGQLRNLATTGGNLMQRTRCAYFQDVSTPCNKRDPGSGCAALEGWTRYHAILGSSEHCVAVHPSDMAVALCALDAIVEVHGPGGKRRIPLVEFHRLPEDQPQHDTVLARDELITSIDIPELPFATTSHYRKIRDRASFAFALVSVAAALNVANGQVRDVRLAFGGVAHKPWRATTAERNLRGAPATMASFRAAAEAELQAADALPDNQFKIPMAREALASTLAELAERTEEES